MVFLVAGFGVAISRPAAAEQTFMDHCLDSYLQKKECPADICQLRCIHDTPDCVKMCLPKECPKIDVAHCPGKYCEVMTDCSDQKICHYQMMGEKPESTNIAISHVNLAVVREGMRRAVAGSKGTAAALAMSRFSIAVIVLRARSNRLADLRSLIPM